MMGVIVVSAPVRIQRIIHAVPSSSAKILRPTATGMQVEICARVVADGHTIFG